MRPSHKSIILSPFTDSEESGQVEEHLLLASGATGYPKVYLCLHPSREERVLEFTHGIENGTDGLKELARILLNKATDKVLEVADLKAHDWLGYQAFFQNDPAITSFLSFPIRFENQFLGFLILLDSRHRKLTKKQHSYLATVVKGIIRLFEQRRLKTQNELFRERVMQAEELGGLGYWEFELKDDTLFWSNGVYRMFGVERKSFQVSPETFFEMTHPEDVPAIREQQEAIARGERTDMDLEHRVIRPDGRIIWVHERGRLIRDAQGTPRTFQGTVQDITEVKKRQEELIQYTAFMEATLANLPIGVSLYRIDDRVTTYSNDKFYEITGWNRNANPDGYTFMKKLYPDPDTRKARLTQLENSLSDPELHGKEWKAQKITTAGGDKKLVNTRYVLLREHKLILLILSDVTEIHRTKEILSLANERYRLATLATSDVLWDSDLVNKEHFWGENYKRTFGHEILDDPKENFKDWENHVHPDDIKQVTNELIQTLEGDARIWKAEYRYRHGQTGEYLRVKDQGYILRNEQGKAIRMVGAMQDFTEKYKQEEQLELFASAIANTSDGILITESSPAKDSQEQRITYVNSAFEAITGYSAEELVGEKIGILRGPKTDSEAIKKLQRRITKMKSATTDLINYRKNGDEFWVNLSVTPVVHEETGKVHYISIQREISLPKAEELNRKLINRLSKDLSQTFNHQRTVEQLCKSVGQVLEAEIVECWVKDELLEHISPLGFYASNPAYKEFQYEPTEVFSLQKKGLVSQLEKRGKPIGLREIGAESSPLWRREKAERLGINALFAIPLYSGTEFVGGLLVYYKDGFRDFNRIMTRRLKDCDRFIGAEIKRKQLNEQLTDILNSVPDMICMIGQDGMIKKVNPGMVRILGYTESELLNQSLDELVHPDDVYPSLRELSRSLKGEKIPYFENRMRTKDGHFIWVAWSASNLHNYRQFLVVGKDISDTRKYLEHIQESNERFRLVSEASNDAIWEWNVAKDQLIWTEGFERNFGYEPGSHYVLKDWENKVHPEDLERVRKKSNELFQDPTRDTLLIDYRFQRSDGSYAYVTDHSRILRSSQGQVITMVGAMQDVTHRREHEKKLLELNDELQERNEQLESSNTELEHFAYVASHDLQEPLRMISGFLTQLEKKYYDQLDEKGRTYIHYAVDGSKRMRTIIRELLEYSRVGRVDDKKEEVPISTILDEVEVVYRILLQQCNGKIDRPQEMPIVYGHRVLIFQLFQNLIDNALKYRKKEVDPEVRISWRDKGNYWEFDVADNGIGIDPAYFEKIFVIFQRLHQKDEYGGAGMGLTTARKIVDTMGGRIKVDSKKGVGTTFTFSIRKEKALKEEL